MLSLDDSRWATLTGGYHDRYDASPALRRLHADWTDAGAWEELWGELHHQGDVGEASYAAVPVLVALGRAAPARDWNLYALAATIETERHRRGNPPVPGWLAPSYRQAWMDLLELALSDLRMAAGELVISALAVVALARGEMRLGALLGDLDSSEIEELTDDRLGWPGTYPPNPDSPLAPG